MKRKRPKRASAGDDRRAKAAAVEGAAAPAASAAPAAPAAPAKRKAKKPRPAKKQLEEPAPKDEDEDAEEGEEEDDGEDDEDGDEEAEEEDDGDLEVDFEFFDPSEDDYHSVGDLIKSGLWEFVEINFAELTDSIVGQGNIGSLIKSESQAGGAAGDKEDTVCGLLTALNLRQFASQSWPRTIGDALLKKAEKHAGAEVVEKLRGYLKPKEGSEAGLLLSERFVNLPPQLVPPLHKALLDDIEWSCNTPECPPEERPFYHFTHFVGIARCYQAKPDAAGAGPKAKRRKGAAAAAEAAASSAASGGGGLVFPKPEDEVYFRKAAFSFTFPLSDAASSKQRAGGHAPSAKETGGRGPEMRLVFGLTRKALEQVVAELGRSPTFRPE